MLTITFDPTDPLDALESCAAFAELLGDYVGQRRADLDIPERAASAVEALCAAIAQAQDRAVAALLAARRREEEARGRAAAPVPATPVPDPVTSIAAACGVPVAEVQAMLARGLAASTGARAEAAPAARKAGGATPRLTEPRAAAAAAAPKRRRAA